nr:uncharacterized protein LOC111415631 [Onthophagus taurus]XP_022908336.1 uncharacterized protein LOC111419707 [Onthophagus taurus]
MANSIGDLFKQPNFILKFVEFIICLVAWILWYVDPPIKAFDDQPSHDTVVIAIIGYTWVSLAFIITYIFDETQDLLEMLLTFFGFAYHFVSCIFIFILHSNYKGYKTDASTFWVIMGIFCLVVAVLCLVDFILKIANKK